MAYLVRRLLENGANTSFVNRLADEEAPIDEHRPRSGRPPSRRELERGSARRAAAASAGDLRARARATAAAWRSTSPPCAQALLAEIGAELKAPFAAAPIVDGRTPAGGDAAELVLCPHDRRAAHRHGARRPTPPPSSGDRQRAQPAAHAWDRLGGPARAAILERAADLYERDRARLMAVMVREAGKTLENALGDVREAVDFLRYYAVEARRLFSGPVTLKGPTGETQHCWSCAAAVRSPASRPWNFPLAIFTGQVAAALAAGNPVLAKPAEQTPITAFLAARAAARGRRAAGRAAAAARRRRGRRRAGQGPARGGRRLHRLQRDRLGDPEARWPSGAAPSCRSSPRPAASTP